MEDQADEEMKEYQVIEQPERLPALQIPKQAELTFEEKLASMVNVGDLTSLLSEKVNLMLQEEIPAQRIQIS